MGNGMRRTANADLYVRLHEQRRVMKAQCVLIALAVMVIGLAGWQSRLDQRVIEAQAGTLAAADERIEYLEMQLADLQGQMDAAALERAVTTSRGTGRSMMATVTAYTWTGDKTASGTWPKEGRTIAGPRWVPFGTKVYIDGIGWRIVEDRTHIRFDGRWDVYMDSRGRCLEWGKQEREVQLQ